MNFDNFESYRRNWMVVGMRLDTEARKIGGHYCTAIPAGTQKIPESGATMDGNSLYC